MEFVTTLQQELKLRGFVFNKEQSAEILRAFADAFLDHMRNGEGVRIPFVGAFVITERPGEYIWSNLLKKQVYVEPRRLVKYRASKTAKEALRRSLNETGS